MKKIYVLTEGKIKKQGISKVPKYPKPDNPPKSQNPKKEKEEIIITIKI